MTSLISLGLVLNLFLMRPSALGEQFTALGMALALPLTGLHLFHSFRTKRYSNQRLRGEMAGLFGLLAIYWVYIGPISIYFERSELLWTMKEFFTTLVVVLCYGVFLIDERANRLFFRQFCTVVALLGLSSVITVALTSLLGSRLPLYLFTVTVKGYSEANVDPTATTGAIYFPFSMLYSDYVSGAVKLDRYCAFFREAGIYQAVACFCLAYEAFTRRSKIIMFGLVAGTICAFSSLGIALLALTIGLIYLFTRAQFKIGRALVTLVLVSLVYPVALYTPYIGLEDKAATHGTSISDRSASISRAIDNAMINPIGYGLYTGKEQNDGICLLAQLGMIGLFGFVCQVMILSAWRPGTKIDWRKMAACSPLLVTALISQPIAGAPATYVMLMAFVPAASRRLAARHAPDFVAANPIMPAAPAVAAAAAAAAVAATATMAIAPMRDATPLDGLTS